MTLFKEYVNLVGSYPFTRKNLKALRPDIPESTLTSMLKRNLKNGCITALEGGYYMITFKGHLRAIGKEEERKLVKVGD